MSITITGTGSKLPERIIPNSQFLNNTFYDGNGIPMTKPAEEIVTKLESITGIKERRYIPEDQDSVPLMTAAALAALQDSGFEPNQIDGIIVAHNAGNMLVDGSGWHSVPNMASLVKNKLGIANHECFAYDILFGCPGWLQGIIQADQIIKNNDASKVLVIGVEVASRFLDPHDLDSMILADGCGACVISKNDLNDSKGILSYATFSHCQDDLMSIYLDKSKNPDDEGNIYFKMNGKEVYKYATTWVPQVIKKALDKINMPLSEVDIFLFHQANGKMLEVFANNLGALYGVDNSFFAGKIPSTIQFTGNTSVATIPTMLDLIRKKQLPPYEIKEGQLAVMASVGAGMHCNALVYRF